jgi:hypothetical protein
MFRDELLLKKFEELRFIIDEIPNEKRPRVRELWNSWATGLKLMKSEATIRSLAGTWKHLEPIIGDLSVEQITGEFWTNEIIVRVRAKTHPTFVFFNMRKWLGMFMKWCDANNKAPHGWRRPVLVDPDPERAPGRAYSIDETDRLYAHADWGLKPKLVMNRAL